MKKLSFFSLSLLMLTATSNVKSSFDRLDRRNRKQGIETYNSQDSSLKQGGIARQQQHRHTNHHSGSNFLHARFNAQTKEAQELNRNGRPAATKKATSAVRTPVIGSPEWAKMKQKQQS